MYKTYTSFSVSNLVDVAEYYSFEVSELLKKYYTKRFFLVRKFAYTFALMVDVRITGFIDYFQILKVFFLAFFSIDDHRAYTGKNVNQLIFPHFEEYIIGVCIINASLFDKSTLIKISRRHVSVEVFGYNFLLLFRKPVLLDLEYVVLTLGERSPFKFFIHNKFFHQKLQNVSSISKRLNNTRPPVHVPVLTSGEKGSHGQIISIVNSRNKETFNLYVMTIGFTLRKFGFFFKEVDISDNDFNILDYKNSSLLILGQQSIINECFGTGSIDLLEGFNILNCDYFSLLNNNYLRKCWLPEGKLVRYISKSIEIEEPGFKISQYKIEKPIKINLYKEVGIYVIEGEDSGYFDNESSSFKMDDGRSSGVHYNISPHTIVFHYLLDQKCIIRDDNGSLNEALAFYKQLIIKTAKKPLVLKECPRFLFLKLDDCTLEKSSRHLEEIGKTGFYTNVGLLMFDVLADRMLSFRELRYPSVRFTPHAGGWKHSFWKNVINKKNYPLSILNRNKEYIKAYFDNFKIKYSPVTHSHFYSMGTNAISVLTKMGIVAGIMNSPPNTVKNKFVSFPTGHPSYGYGFYEDGFFYLNFEDHNKFKYIHGNRWDFLKQCSKINGRGDVSKAIQRGYLAVRKAFLSGFPAILSTHEFRMIRFTSHEIRKILEEILKKLKQENLDPVLMDDIAVVNYLKNHMAVQIDEIAERNGNITVKTNRTTSVNLRFVVYGKNGLSRDVLMPKGKSLLSFRRRSYA